MIIKIKKSRKLKPFWSNKKKNLEKNWTSLKQSLLKGRRKWIVWKKRWKYIMNQSR